MQGADITWVRFNVAEAPWHLRCSSLWPRYHRTECGNEWPEAVGSETAEEPTTWCEKCRAEAVKYGRQVESPPSAPVSEPTRMKPAEEPPRANGTKAATTESPDDRGDQAGLF